MERDFPTSEPRDLIRASDEAQSAVSWAAIFAGALAALALSFVLMALAAGFGLKLASPWPGASASRGFTPILGAWMVAIQVLSSALGGYLAGRLRTKWSNVHGHEVHFRDTAHGLLVWALSTVAGAILAVTILAPAAANLADLAAAAAPPVPLDPIALQIETARAANVAAQLSLFTGIGLLLGAFTASVAAAIGGMRRDEMHATFWAEQARRPVQP